MRNLICYACGMKKLLFILLITIPFIGFGQSEEKIKYWENG